MSPLLFIFFYSALIALASYCITVYTTLKDDKKVLFNAFVVFVLTCLVAYNNYQSGKDAQAQSDRVEDNIQIVKKLSELNNAIDKKTQLLVLKNDSLTDSIHKLIQKVNIITSSIHKETSEEIAEHTLTGKLDFHLNKTFSDNEEVFVVYGGNPSGQKVKRLKAIPSHFLRIGSKDYGTVKMKNNQLLYTIKIFDFTGKWILDIDNNYWVRNPNNTGAFNYNDTSFEVLDNYGNVALNIDLQKNNTILIHGYAFQSGGLMAFGNSMTSMPINAKTKLEDISIFLERAGVTQIFYHTGVNWLHRRLPQKK